MNPPKESAAPQLSIGLTKTNRVRLRFDGQEWALPWDLCLMLLSDQTTRERLRVVTRQSMQKCAEIQFVVTQDEGE